MKKYEESSDREILQQIKNGDNDAMEYLMKRYRGMVRTEARKFFLAGGDEEDLIQEGMIGLFKAINSYEEDKNTSFSTFAFLCIRRQIYTTVTASNRKKHGPLNNYVSIFGSAQDLDENHPAGMIENPEEMVLKKERMEGYYLAIEKKLSRYEKQVMKYYVKGENYTEIAKKLNKTDKSIDNAIQRIRRKLMEDS